MLKYKSFTEKVKKVVSEKITEGNYFLFCFDIMQFHVITEIYGLEKAALFLEKVEDFLSSIDNVVAWERMYSDHFIALVHFDEAVDDEKLIERYKKYKEKLIVSLKDEYSSCVIDITTGIFKMNDNEYIYAIDGANQARKAAKKAKRGSTMVFCCKDIERSVFGAKKAKELDEALKKGDFTFYLQPKVDLKSGKIIGSEALVRRINNGKVILPGEFLDVMEENGSIVKLDFLVYEKVCEHISERLKHKKNVVPISVNLSALHFSNPETLDMLHSIAKTYSVPPKYLEFEITETLIAESMSAVKKFIKRARELGYAVSIDDFGAGYAGINMWREYDVNTVKLDRSFLNENEEVKARNYAILPNIINAFTNMNSIVLCEGVETKEQCVWLISMGCTVAQGYYFSKPMTVEDFYEYYDKKDYYELEYKSQEKEDVESVKLKFGNGFNIRSNIVLIASFLVLIVVYIGTLGIQEKIIESFFAEDVKNTLNSFNMNQTVKIKTIISGIESNLVTVAELVTEEDMEKNISHYIDALNLKRNNASVNYVYTTKENLIKSYASEEEWLNSDVYHRMIKGEVIRGTIKQSSYEDKEEWFGLTVPVIEEGEIAGTVSAVVRASVLTQVDESQLSFGRVKHIIITDNENRILYSTCGDKSVFQMPITEHISAHLPLVESYEEVKQALNKESENLFVIFKDEAGKNNYVNVTKVKYNDWKLFVIYESEFAHAYSQQMADITRKNITAITCIIVILMILVVYVFRKETMKRESQKARHEILEQFSDTMLFDYNYKKDIITFTQSTEQYFDLSWAQNNKHEGFLKGLARIGFIYPADHGAIHRVLNGIEDMEENVSVRVKNHQDKYVWCNVRYKYIYENGKFSGVVGKMSLTEKQE